MTTSSQLLLIGALGALSVGASGNAVAQVDTSAWKCEYCLFEEGTSGSVEAGVANVSESSARFGDYTGLRDSGAYLAAGGDLRVRSEDGTFADVNASNLGLDSRSLTASGGREGKYSLRLGYSELPRYLSDTALTPFLGSGGPELTLPPGFSGGSTADMPLATTLQPAELAYKRSRLGLGATLLTDVGWTFRLDAGHMVRDGTARTSGSFFATAAQLVAPLDQTTDSIDATASYLGHGWNTTLAYHGSIFRNRQDSLIWANPFTLGPLGGGRGQLALAPDNQFHQLQASVGYEISPMLRASGDIALGRMTQDAPFLASTLNAGLVVAPLPAASLDGRVDTLNANLRLSASPTERLRLNAILTRNERDNRTPIAFYPTVSTDMFVGQARSNQPYSFTQNQFKFGGDYRGDDGLKLAAGVEYDDRHRSLQEVDRTREGTIFGRIGAQATDELGLSLKLAHGERKNSGYNSVAWVTPAENPLLRKYNLATRRRDSALARADVTVSETVSLGLDADLAYDDYPSSPIGLTYGRSYGIGADLAVALSEQTHLSMFVHADKIRSEQSGSQGFTQPDWSARNTDTSHVLGLGVRHAAIKDKLDIGADLAFSRSNSDVVVDTGATGGQFPSASTGLDSVKLYATYRLRKDLTLAGSFWYEHYQMRDWHYDGVLPDTVANLLAFGEQPAQYHVNVFQVTLRYRF